MILHLHRGAAIVATLCIASFFSLTLITELVASHATIALVKAAVVWPGLWILIPAMALTGITGNLLAKKRRGKLIQQKLATMKIIAANGLLILVPCAIVLNQWAQAQQFDTIFYLVQGVELLAGATNLCLLIANARRGMKLTQGARKPRH
ncbi:hypothetical protein FLM48_05045 [Shewanella sp. Scap07]|uniref:hypothetical protein n=1 Tax=Shewanella sp. Scap07 TaxID=2589987 RepID=UPI0015B91B31|nr:hypothetical protein [Shewanella sp. Scap07]QLE84512.1 hypothetical protein FLM48_05045 [Shewanella sp. Scap07]